MTNEGDAAHVETREETLSFAQKVKREVRDWAATIAVLFPLFLAFSWFAYEQRIIPSESMVPNLEVSDRVAVAKFAYGYDRYSLPLNLGRILPLSPGRVFARTPRHGDVAVFEHTYTQRVMIKRIIGLPGDRIQMINEAVILNGEPLVAEHVRDVQYVPHGRSRLVSAQEWRETIGDTSWLTHRQGGGDAGDNTVLFVVPEGHLFLMGDNRDNSLDSRVLTGHCPPENGVVDRTGCALSVPADIASVGFVPMDHLLGRGETVLLSLFRCALRDDAKCKKRVWKGL